MQGNSINPKYEKVRLWNGRVNLPCIFRYVIRFEVPYSLCDNIITFHDDSLTLNRTFFQRLDDFFNPKYIVVYYSERFDNSKYPMVFTMVRAEMTKPIPPSPPGMVYYNPPFPMPSESPSGNTYNDVEESFDRMVASMDDASKQFLEHEDFEAVSRVSRVKNSVLVYKEKVLNDIIENKGVAKKSTTLPLITEMVKDITAIIPEIADQLHMLTQFDFKN